MVEFGGITTVSGSNRKDNSKNEAKSPRIFELRRGPEEEVYCRDLEMR